MKIAQLLFSSLIFISLSGCTQYWYQSGMSIEQAQADHNECFKSVLQAASSTTSMTTAQMQEMENCMIQKGYALVMSGQIPKQADKIEAASSPYWKLYGVAGLPRDRSYPLFEY